MTNKKGINIESIINLYNEGKSPTEISELLHCTLSNITRRLKKSGIEFSRDYNKTRFTRIGRHSLNTSFFKEINTEEQAYFLGLMYADGSVSNNGFYLKLKDSDIIEKFQKVLGTDSPVKRIYYGGYKAYIIQICSREMSKDLIKLGCFINKTKKIRLPDIKQDLIRHFIRGFFDGDGCLQLNDKIYHNRFDLTSASKEFLEDVRPIIASHGITRGSLNKETNYNVWHLSFSGHQVKQILDWLYKDAEFYLLRKYVKYQLLSSPKIG